MADIDESTKKAFELAGDITKQLILLASGILTFTVTFARDKIVGDVWSSAINYLLLISWILFCISIGFGLLTMMFMTGNLQRNQKPSVDPAGIRLSSILQQVVFMMAIIMTFAFGVVSLSNNKIETSKTPPTCGPSK